MLEAVQLPEHRDFRYLRHTPAEVRGEFMRRGWNRVVAFQTRNPMHRAHQELTLRAALEADASVLIHPVVGITKPGDIDHYTRVRCYQAILPQYPQGKVLLSLLPLAMRMGGPREALWHAISQELVRRHAAELGVQIIPFRQLVYSEDQDAYIPVEEAPPGARVLHISGTQLRRRLAEGRKLPRWFTAPEIAAELRRSYRPRSEQGFTVFFTGLSGAGKSTIAGVLLAKLLERGGRHVTLLDGDLVRQHLSSELGFSREHRDVNVLRTGFVAAEITKHQGVAICALIAPYEAARREMRRMIEQNGGFVLVHVVTPLDVCEQRDRKGLYLKARMGLLPHFTGVSDPYEEPSDADLVVDARAESPDQADQRIIDHLQGLGYLTRLTPLGSAEVTTHNGHH